MAGEHTKFNCCMRIFFTDIYCSGTLGFLVKLQLDLKAFSNQICLQQGCVNLTSVKTAVHRIIRCKILVVSICTKKGLR